MSLPPTARVSAPNGPKQRHGYQPSSTSHTAGIRAPTRGGYPRPAGPAAKRAPGSAAGMAGQETMACMLAGLGTGMRGRRTAAKAEGRKGGPGDRGTGVSGASPSRRRA